MVRLKRFINNYPNNIRLFKLHGSVDTFSANLMLKNLDRTRIKTDYGISDFFKESINTNNGELEYIKGVSSVFPDFLSGTTEKIINYNDEYYSIIFNHFTNNISNCDKLIIIGYGFGDDGINKILEKSYLSKGLLPVVIDPNISTSPFYIANKFNHVQRSITQLSQADLLNL